MERARDEADRAERGARNVNDACGHAGDPGIQPRHVVVREVAQAPDRDHVLMQYFVGQCPRRDCGDVARRDEVPSFRSSAEDHGAAGIENALAVEGVSVPFHERRRAEHDIRQTARREVLLDRPFRAEEVDGMVRRCSEC